MNKMSNTFKTSLRVIRNIKMIKDFINRDLRSTITTKSIAEVSKLILHMMSICTVYSNVNLLGLRPYKSVSGLAKAQKALQSLLDRRKMMNDLKYYHHCLGYGEFVQYQASIVLAYAQHMPRSRRKYTYTKSVHPPLNKLTCLISHYKNRVVSVNKAIY
jgi:hypothetical protein